ncbi:MAG TPA: SusC/RagA family TonB-linked outer membrane protein, partial [Gemmatimonadaceae bacterium]|nr:SusC/RagA family TonB-linked outer membrane protein [Gemmatimonadaceae bacterium]
LSVRRIGYQPRTITAAIGAPDVRIVLSERALELGGVVVTGTAGVTEKRAIGNAVTTVNASELVATQPINNFQDLLTGRASGVSVVASSGQVGTGSRIRVRGASSLSLDNNPLIFVDGVRVDNTQGSGPTTQGFGSQPISRWNDFNPDDIESLEVIKGPAAATLYGTEAAAGVIQIITKKGAAGRPTWNATFRMGSSWVPDWRTRFEDNWGRVPVAGSSTAFDTVTLSTRQLNDSLQSNFGREIFEAGLLQDLQLNVSGGTPALRYYIGGGYEENQGAEPVNRLHRTSLRVNLSATPSDKWDVQGSMGYTTGRTYMPYEAGGGGAVWGTLFSSPGFLYNGRDAGNPQLGFRSGPPDIYYQAYNNFQDADRFTGSVTLTNRATSWFNQRLILGVDRLAEDNQSLTPRNDPLAARYASFASAGPPTRGSMAISTRDVTVTTFDYLANLDLKLSEGWRSISSVGGQFFGRKSLFRAASANDFPAAGLVSLAAAAVRNVTGDEVFENNTVGGFVQQQLAWNNRLFLTAAVRADDNSAFGTNFDVVTYPKLSASYVISEEPSIALPGWVDQLRLRAAYGGSGQQPGAFDATRTYLAQGGFLTPGNAGNPDLGPERSTELELGFDAGLLDDRVGLDVTTFFGTTKDAILSRLAPPSAGFPGSQLFNAGEVQRRGIEWQVRWQALNRENLGLDFTINGSTLEYEITDLGGEERINVSSTEQHVVGYAPGAWFDRRLVSADFDPVTRRATNIRCDDGNGGSVECANAPRVFRGNTVPTREGSVGVGLTLFKDLRVNAFFDYRGGYSKLDGNRRVRCNLFSLCEINYFPERYDPVLVAEAQNGTAYTTELIQDAGFTRFRELSATYTLPASVARALKASRASVTVAGRNLGLWTNFRGIEPEASFNGGTRGGFGQWEQNVLPQLRSFVTTINLNF